MSVIRLSACPDPVDSDPEVDAELDVDLDRLLEVRRGFTSSHVPSDREEDTAGGEDTAGEAGGDAVDTLLALYWTNRKQESNFWHSLSLTAGFSVNSPPFF